VRISVCAASVVTHTAQIPSELQKGAIQTAHGLGVDRIDHQCDGGRAMVDALRLRAAPSSGRIAVAEDGGGNPPIYFFSFLLGPMEHNIGPVQNNSSRPADGPSQSSPSRPVRTLSTSNGRGEAAGPLLHSLDHQSLGGAPWPPSPSLPPPAPAPPPCSPPHPPLPSEQGRLALCRAAPGYRLPVARYTAASPHLDFLLAFGVWTVAQHLVRIVPAGAEVPPEMRLGETAAAAAAADAAGGRRRWAVGSEGG
jgi:hypothetical protein